MYQYKEKMSVRDYEHYKMVVKHIEQYGQKEDLERLYAEIRLKYADCDEDLHDLDKYQSKWCMGV